MKQCCPAASSWWLATGAHAGMLACSGRGTYRCWTESARAAATCCAAALQAYRGKVAADMQAFHKQHKEVKASRAEAQAKEEARQRQQAQQQAAAEATKAQAAAKRKKQQNLELK